MLNSQYPIIALAMNQVSDAKFAVACADAGVYPTITVATYYDAKFNIEYHRLVDDLVMFKTARGNCDVMFSIYHAHVIDELLLTLLQAAGIRILEVIMPWKPYDIEEFRVNITKIKDMGFTLMMRSIAYNKKAEKPAHNGSLYPYFDILLMKGNRGAGAVSTQSLEEMFFIAKNDYPDKKLVAAGGIYSKRQMNLFLENGALAIGIGTLFAASQESCLSDATKQKMIEADFNKVKESTYQDKNALVFAPLRTPSDPNFTPSLKLGIMRPDIGGHIYCGEGIDSIKAVLSLKEIVANLVN